MELIRTEIEPKCRQIGIDVIQQVLAFIRTEKFHVSDPEQIGIKLSSVQMSIQSVNEGTHS